ncbi:hypothetical protein SY88_18285 [Clostridiales bacterium PH28_bin88]|nr:hypothetical protein SY88_18285 [Clostridiales bacterium PH28_bin88]
MKRAKRLIGFLLVLLFPLSAFGCAGSQERQVVAVVNGEEILRSQLDHRLEQFKSFLKGQGMDVQGKEDSQAWKEVADQSLESLIQDVLLRQAAKEQGIDISREGVEQKIAQVKKMAGSDKEFQDFLQQQELSEEDFSFQIEQGLLAERLYQKVTAEIRVEEQEVQDYFTANKELLMKAKVRQILIPVPPDENKNNVIEEAKAKSQEVITQLDNGADFAEVAKKYAEGGLDQTHAGMILEEVAVNDPAYPPAFVSAVFSLREGQHTPEPVRTPLGFHIIRVEEILDSMAELKGDIERLLLEKKKDQAFQKFYEEFRQTAKIQRF